MFSAKISLLQLAKLETHNIILISQIWRKFGQVLCEVHVCKFVPTFQQHHVQKWYWPIYSTESEQKSGHCFGPFEELICLFLYKDLLKLLLRWFQYFLNESFSIASFTNTHEINFSSFSTVFPFQFAYIYFSFIYLLAIHTLIL